MPGSREEVEQMTIEVATYRVPKEHCGVVELLGPGGPVGCEKQMALDGDEFWGMECLVNVMLMTLFLPHPLSWNGLCAPRLPCSYLPQDLCIYCFLLPSC